MGRYPNISDTVFVSSYGASIVVFLVGVLVRGLLFAVASIRKTTELHNKMFKCVIYARMSFFDSTPIGRVLNAFARHQFTIDAHLTESLFQFLQYAPVVLAAVVLMMIIMYPTIGIFAGVAIFVTIMLVFLGTVEARLRNHDALTKSATFGHLTASLEGLFSIRAYQCEKRFIELFKSKIGKFLNSFLKLFFF